MRALVFHGPGRMELTSVQQAPLAAGEIRVKVRHAGICGTDLRILQGTKYVDAPRIIGHEFAGTIVEAAKEVKGFSIGERVVVYPMITCGSCYACVTDRKNICVNRRTIGYEIDGAFAEFVTVPAEAVRGGNVVRVPEDVSDLSAGASEPVAAAMHGVRRAGDLNGRTVLVMGGGPLGLAHAQLTRLSGAESIVMSEPQAERRVAALAHGATEAISPCDVAERFRKLGPDVAFVDVGIPSLVAQASELVRKGGRVVIFAGMSSSARVELNPNVLHYGEIDVVGSSGSTPELHAQVLAHAQAGRLNLESLVSDVLPLEAWSRGFDMKKSATGLKILLELST